MSSVTDNGPFLCVEEVTRLFKISRTKAYKEAQLYIETTGKAGRQTLVSSRDRHRCRIGLRSSKAAGVGKPLGADRWGYYLGQARKRAGRNDSIRYHDLRHFFASVLIASGCSRGS